LPRRQSRLRERCAADPDAMRETGQILLASELATEYGFSTS